MKSKTKNFLSRVKSFLDTPLGRYVVPLSLFIVLFGAPVALFVTLGLEGEASSWYDSNWQYKQDVTITYSGTAKTNYDVLIELDTAALITASKIQADCDDIRLIDSDDVTPLTYWIEGGCNTTTTQIWAQVPNIPDGGKDIYFYYGNGSAVNAEETWAGKFITLNTGSCPVGWTDESAASGDFDDRFPYAAATYGTTGGALTHSHSNATCSAGGGSNGFGRIGGGRKWAVQTHTHSNIQVAVNSSASLRPPYLDMVYCSNTDSILESGQITVFDNTVPAGWTRYSALDAVFPRGAASYGGTGGSDTHTHSTTGGYNTSTSSYNSNGNLIDSPNSVAANHYHTSGSSTTGSGSNLPSYTDVIFGQADAGTTTPANAILMTSAVPPLGWVRISALDGTYLRGAAAYGATGGTATHTHSVTISTGQGNVGSTLTGSGGGYSHRQHAHSCSTTTNSGSNLPPHMETVFVKKNDNSADSVSISFGSETANGPATPTIGTPAAQSTSSIRWNFTDNASDEDGFKVYDTNDTVVATCAVSNLTYCDEVGLAMNASYTRKVVAYNGSGDSGFSATASRYTLASIHVPTIYEATTDSITIKANGTIRTLRDSYPGLTDSLSNYWIMGTTPDYKGTRNLTSINGYATTSGIVYGPATDFEKDLSQYYETGDHAELSTGDIDFSIAAWVKLESFDDTHRMIVSKHDGVGNREYILYLHDDVGIDPSFCFITYNSDGSAAAGSACYGASLPINTGTWYHIVGVHDSVNDTLKLYVDGTLGANVGTLGEAPGDTTASFRIGAYNGSQDTMDGAIDDVAFWKRALDQDDVDKHRLAVNSYLYFDAYPQGSSAVYYDCTGSSCDTGLNSWTTDGLDTATGLLPNTLYEFRVKGRNGDSIETGYGTAAPTYTLANTPTIAVDSITDTTMTLSASNTNNVSQGSSGLFFDCTDAGCDTGINSWTQSLTDIVTDLSPNTQYTYQVKTRNGDSTETLYSSTVSKYSGAATPTGPTYTLIGTNSVTLNFTEGGNPAETEYTIRDTISGLYINASTGVLDSATDQWNTFAGWGEASGQSVTGLTSGTQYDFRVFGRNGNGVWSTGSTITSATTLMNAPTILAPTNLDSTSIRWNFTDNESNEDGFKVYKDSDSSLQSTCATPDLTYCDETGLSVNTLYTRKVTAYNSVQESPYSGPVSKATTANIPGRPVVSNETTSSVTVVIDQNGNPVNTDFTMKFDNQYVDPGTGTLGASPVYGTYAAFGGPTGVVVTGLTVDTSYVVKVGARNVQFVSTSDSLSETAVTLSNVPTAPSLTAISSSSINAVINQNGNPSVTGYVLYENGSGQFVNSSTGVLQAGADWQTYAVWGSGSGINVTGLSENTSYEFKVKSRNGDNVETVYSSGVSLYTLSNVPTSPTLTMDTTTSINAEITQDTHPASTEFALYETITGNYVNRTTGALQASADWGTVAQWGSTIGTDVIGLSINTQYTFYRKARNGDNIEAFNAGNTASLYTRTQSAGTPTVEVLSPTSVKVTHDPKSNPSYTEFKIKEVVSGDHVDISTTLFAASPAEDNKWNTYAQWGGASGYTITGLISGTSYEILSANQNGDGDVRPSASVTVITGMNAPTIDSPVLLSSTSIRWKFIDNDANEIGFKIYKDSDDSLKATCAAPNLTLCDETGLTPNTSYTRKVTAYNAIQESSYSSATTLVTMAALPSAPAGSPAGSTVIFVEIYPGANPSSTEFVVKVGSEFLNHTTGTLQATEDWGTYADFDGATGMNITGLVPGTEYVMSVKARNSDLVETAFGAVNSEHTRPAVPIVAGLTALSATSLNIVIGENNNAADVEYLIRETGSGEYVDFSTNILEVAETWGTYADFGSGTGTAINSLSVDTEYTFEIRAKNAVGYEVWYGATSSLYTLSIAPTTLTVTAQSPTVLNVLMALDGNPSSTDFAILETISGNYVNSSSGALQISASLATYAGFGGATGIGVTGLSPNTTYTFKNSTINGDGVWADNVGTQSEVTLANTPGAPTTNVVSTTIINVIIDPAGNPALTYFAIQEVTTGKFVNKGTGLLQASADWGTYANWMSGSGVDVRGLTSGTDYEFRVKARNSDLIETPYSPSDSAATNLEAPTIGNATVLTSSSIRWNFTDNESNEDGFRVYDESNVMVAQCIGQDLAYCDESGLAPNVSYTRKIIAYNTTGSSPYSATDTAVTFASVPGAPILAISGSTTVHVVIDENGNPAGTDYLIQDVASGYYLNFTTGELQSEQTGAWGTYADFGGAAGIDMINLLANAEYSLKVKARNSVSVTTAYGTSAFVYTGTIDLGAPTLTALSSTSINVEIDNGGNNASTEFRIKEVGTNRYVDHSTGGLVVGEVWGTYADLGSASGIPVTGLGVNMSYTFNVVARNGDEILGDVSPSASLYTLSNTPAAPTVSLLTPESIRIQTDQNGNPIWSTYAMKDDLSSRRFDIIGMELALFGETPSYTGQWRVAQDIATGIESGTAYSVASSAANGDGVATSFGATTDIITDMYTPTPTSAVAISSDSVRVNFIDNEANETGFKLYWIDGTTQAGDCSTPDLTYCDRGGLSPNQSYGTRVTSYNAIQESPVSGVVYATTYAEVPGVPVASNISQTAFTLTVASNGNPTDTEFLVTESNTGKYLDYLTGTLSDTATWATYSDFGGGSGLTVSGLSASTNYQFTVKARNADLVETVVSGILDLDTLSMVPNTPTVTAIGSNSLNIIIDGNGNPTTTEFLINEIVSGKYISLTGELSDTEIWGTYADFGADSGVDIGSLLSNAQYTFQVKARNDDDVESIYGASQSRYTLVLDIGDTKVTATSSTSLKVVVDSGFNNLSTELYVREVNTGKYVDHANGQLVGNIVWGTVPDWEGGSGVEVLNLSVNTIYQFNVRARNGDDILGASSGIVGKYTLANKPGLSALNYSANRILTTVARSGNPTNTIYRIKELTTDRFVGGGGALKADITWLTYSELGSANGIYVTGFTPGSQYRFGLVAQNGDGVETDSVIIDRYALPKAPVIGQNSLVSTTSVRLEILRNGNDNSVRFLIKDFDSGLFLDPTTRTLTTEKIWGTYSDLGSDLGLIAHNLNSGKKYTFRARARNVLGESSGYGPSVTTQMLARIRNLDSDFVATLLRDSNIDVTSDSGAQLGLKEIRLLKDALLVADIPVQFDGDKDWFDATIEVDEEAGKAAISLQDKHGFEGTYTMYVVKGDSNAFLLCPGAEDLESITVDCAQGVIFDGPYPQTKDVEGGNVTVSVAVFDAIEYWVVDGLSGTGGQGITIEEDEGGEVVIVIEDTGETIIDEGILAEEGDDETFIVSLIGGDSDIEAVNSVVNIVQAAPEAIGSVVKGVQVLLDDAVGELDESQLEVVTATATVATVTVATGTVLGGISNIPYFITQLFFAVLAWIGFRKEGKPYGYVYDSVTKKPISRAVVRIYDSKGGLAWTDVTDSYGSFSADLKKGTYQIVARKAGYTYPSKIVKGKIDHPIQDVYHGEKMKLATKKSVNVAIPMDPKRQGSGKEFLNAALKGKLGYWFGQLHLILFFFGSALALYTYQKFPSDLNLGITLLYIPAVTLLGARLLKRPKAYGTVVDSKGKPIKGAIVALKEMKFDRYVSKRVTDENGLYRFLVPGGVYQVEVVNDDIKVLKYEGGSNIVDTTSQKAGAVINKKIVVKRVKKK